VSNRSRRGNLRLWIYGVSILLHVGIAAAAVLAPKPKKSTIVGISLTEAPAKKKPQEENKPPPPPPPPPPPVKAKAAPVPVMANAAAKPSEAPQPADAPPPSTSGMDGFADLGLAMGNGAGGGMPIAANARPVAQAADPAADTTKKVRTLAPKAADACDEAPVKPKATKIVRPTFTDEARAASIEGAVRVEITVDEKGNVIGVKVLRGLGYGLDEAAALAAKQMTFEPGTRCGKAAVVTLTTSMRFSLE